MILRRLLTITILLTSTIWSQAQQINPVPDYVFRNQMSVGRNAVTDTAAYFSIGPRYGATKGFMPPIVGDTATFSSGKRNGLLIFSVQKNKFLYWDSVRVQWSDMAGSSGAYIVAGDTAAMLAPYLRKVDTTSMLTAYLRKGDTASMLGNYVRHAGYGLTKSGQSFLVDTLNIATRAWRQKGLDSLAALEVSGSGTTNYVPKFTAASTIGNSQIFDNGTNVGIGTASPGAKFHLLSATGTAQTQGDYANNLAIMQGASRTGTTSVGGSFATTLSLQSNDDVITAGSGASIGFAAKWNTGLYSSAAQFGSIFGGKENSTDANLAGYLSFATRPAGGNPTERLRITSGGIVGINTQSPDAGTILHTARGSNGTVATFGIQGLTINPRIRIDASETNNTVSFNTNYNGATSPAITFLTAETERLRIFANGRVFVGASPTDAGYQLDINGTLRSVNGANFATTSGNVGIGTASPSQKLEVAGNISVTGVPGGTRYIIVGDATNTYTGALNLQAGGGSGTWGGGIVLYGNSHATYPGGVWIGNSQGASGPIMFGSGGIGPVSEFMRLTGAGELLINTQSDAGDYKLQVAGNIYNTGSAVLAATSGNVGVGVSNPDGELELLGGTLTAGTVGTYALLLGNSSRQIMSLGTDANYGYIQTWGSRSLNLNSQGNNTIINSGSGEVLIGATSDAGDYKLQVVGNARIGSGKLDIATTTTFGLGVARSGTSEVAGQIYNSNGILYLGAESSAGGQIFSGSSAYAAVIGSGANYPLQFAVNNITRGGFSTSGNLLLGFTTDSYFLKLQVNGSIFTNNQFFGQGANAQLSIDSSANISPIYVSNQSLTGTSGQAMLYSNTTWNTTGNPSLLDLNITNTASGATSNYIKITDGTNTFRVTKAAEVVTAAPTGGSIRKWKLGEAATVSPTSPNRTIRVEIDGVVYYLHAKTTND